MSAAVGEAATSGRTIDDAAGLGVAVSGMAGSGAAAWSDALQALALFAADPVGLGGIALRAGPGPVRDHWLMLLQGALKPDAPLRRVPLHVGDERLLGGLDLAATLQAGRPVAQQGLLCEADGGVVLLAMAERIEPGAAARLCATIDDGAVTLQRDGLAHRLPTRFGLVALDEGTAPDEQPPASLLDRMAFHLDVTGVSLRDIRDTAWPDSPGAATPWTTPGSGPPARGPASGQTTQPPAMTRRHAASPIVLERAPAGSGPSLTKEPALCPIDVDPPDGAILMAPDQDPGPGDAAAALCSAALALGIGSLRAPLFALRATRAVAALAGRDQIVEADLGLAARLVFVSRASRFPPAQEAEAPSEAEPSPTSDETSAEQENQEPNTPEQQTLGETRLADVVLEATRAALPPDLLARLALMDAGRGVARAPGRAGQAKISIKRGRPIGTRPGDPKSGARLHLLETLKAAAPWQTLRRRTPSDAPQPGPPRFEVRRDDFRIIRFRQRIGNTTVFAVDASGSAAMHRLGEAKGAVELLLADCYVRRDQVALLAFRGQDATLLLPPTGSLVRAKRSLAGLPGGGPTPLAAGIDAAIALAETVRRTGRTSVITVLTDARANVARDGTAGRPRAEADAIESARVLCMTGVATLLVDTSPRPNPFASRLAEVMRAQYVPLPYANAQALSRAIRAAAAA